jgi:hypothetical protein
MTMTIGTHIAEFEGLSVVEYVAEEGIVSPATKAIRVSMTWDMFDEGQKFVELFAAFLADPAASEVQALIIGDWGGAGQGEDSSPVVEALVSARDKLPKLRALFLGEMIVEESEISWINQSDVSPIFEAFPRLEALYVRGGNGLRLGRPSHDRLRKLVIQTGGMSADIVSDVTSAQLPRLQHLELWLGDDGYGNDVSLDDIRRLLTDGPYDQLTYLGLRDDCRADETSKLLSELKLPATLSVLDLSLGTLSDEGATALIGSPWLSQLQKLDVHHHFISQQVVTTLRTIVSEVEANDVQQPDVWEGKPHRYVAVGE